MIIWIVIILVRNVATVEYRSYFIVLLFCYILVPTRIFLFNRLASISGVDWLSIANVREIVPLAVSKKNLGLVFLLLLIRNAKRTCGTSERRKG